MQAPEQIRAEFAAMLRRPDAEIDLARAALLVAAESDPALDVDAAMARLEEWAETLRPRIDPAWNNLQRLARLRAYMYEELGFKGDRKDYYAPKNSWLHSVMERRLGVPLTLSIVFMELGWRIGVPFEGVGFPGHFLVRLTGEPGDLLLDPFDHGGSVHEEDCIRMLESASGGGAIFDRGMLRSIGKREMITRLLLNLKVASLRAGDDALALSAVERLFELSPESLGELRDRGLLRYRLDRYRDALADLVAYLERRPEARDRATIERHVEALRMIVSSVN